MRSPETSQRPPSGEEILSFPTRIFGPASAARSGLRSSSFVAGATFAPSFSTGVLRLQERSSSGIETEEMEGWSRRPRKKRTVSGTPSRTRSFGAEAFVRRA